MRNAEGLQHYQKMREMQSERNDKYKVHKEAWARARKDEIEGEYAKLQEGLIGEKEKIHVEMSQHERILEEIKLRKREVKQNRLKSKESEQTLHYEQLHRHKLTVQFEALKLKHSQDTLKSAADRERDLEKELKRKEEEIA